MVPSGEWSNGINHRQLGLADRMGDLSIENFTANLVPSGDNLPVNRNLAGTFDWAVANEQLDAWMDNANSEPGPSDCGHRC